MTNNHNPMPCARVSCLEPLAMTYFTDNSLSIGNTPLVRLNRIVDPN